jgi:GcrA cell cycle regulator
MQPTGWAPEHCEELRQLLAKGTSYLQAADAINAKFHTCFTRSAAIGRARRMGIADRQPALPARLERQPDQTAVERLAPEFRRSEFRWRLRAPALERAEPTRRRCVDVDPRHRLLLELEGNDCRYPYGGDEEAEAITFCGHRRRKGSSYCTAHFHLTRNPVIAPEFTVSQAPLRLVDEDWDFASEYWR